jgi:hypothetical protein
MSHSCKGVAPFHRRPNKAKSESDLTDVVIELMKSRAQIAGMVSTCLRLPCPPALGKLRRDGPVPRCAGVLPFSPSTPITTASAATEPGPNGVNGHGHVGNAWSLSSRRRQRPLPPELSARASAAPGAGADRRDGHDHSSSPRKSSEIVDKVMRF